ncbi:MAG: lipoprotein signal peptidase [Bacteroidales bacterium]
MKKPLILIFLILIVDQIIKVYVKTHFYLGEEVFVFGLDWFRIHFIENKGMAFGMNFGDNVGKFVLTFIRLIASVLIFIYIKRLVKKKEKSVIIYSFSLILAGAIGNVVDSLLYGVLFSQSTFFQVATFMPIDGGYAPMLFGKVVDMFYFPLIDTTLPSWLPILGDKHLSFFDAIFNFSDVSITIGVIMLFIAIIINGREEKDILNVEA